MTIQQNDVIEVAARMEFDGIEDMINVFQFQKIDSAVTTDQQGIDDLINAIEVFYVFIKAGMSVLTFFRALRFRNLTQDTVLGTFPFATLTTGDAIADALPPGVAGLINYSTGISRVTPRKYIGGFTEGELDDPGVFTAAAVSALALAGNSLIGVINKPNSDWNFGYLSPKTATFVPVVSATVTSIPAYQRRRKQGRGS